MSLDVYLYAVRLTRVHDANITHNLAKMANAAGIYELIWRPDEIGAEKAEHLIEPLSRGLAELKARPDAYRVFDAANGWGRYEHLVCFIEEYLAACKANPDALVSVSR